VCSLRMIGNVMLPPIAHINSCAVCIGKLLYGFERSGCIPPRGRRVRE